MSTKPRADACTHIPLPFEQGIPSKTEQKSGTASVQDSNTAAQEQGQEQQREEQGHFERKSLEAECGSRCAHLHEGGSGPVVLRVGVGGHERRAVRLYRACANPRTFCVRHNFDTLE